MESKNQALLKESPSRAQKQFTAEQDIARRNWDYLGSKWLNSTSLTTIEDEVERDSDAIGNYGVGYIVIHGGQAVYNDDSTGDPIIETSTNVFEPLFSVR